MVTVDYLLLCQDVTVDESHRNSIINIFDRLHAPAVPVGLRQAKITTRIRPTDKPIVDKDMELTFAFTLDGEEVSTIEITQHITIEVGNSFSPVVEVAEIVFPAYGNYTLELFVDGKLKAENIFMVRDSAELSEP